MDLDLTIGGGEDLITEEGEGSMIGGEEDSGGEGDSTIEEVEAVLTTGEVVAVEGDAAGLTIGGVGAVEGDGVAVRGTRGGETEAGGAGASSRGTVSEEKINKIRKSFLIKFSKFYNIW